MTESVRPLTQGDEELLASLSAAASCGFDATMIVEPAAPWRIVAISERCRTMLGELTGCDWCVGRAGGLMELLPSPLALEVSQACATAVSSGTRRQIELRAQIDGLLRTSSLDVAVTPAAGLLFVALRWKPGGTPEIVQHERDSLTGVATRRAISSVLDARLRMAHASGHRFAVLFLDIDGLKRINDTFGHPTGDAVLAAIGHRLTDLVRGSDVVGRLGGDEFVVVWPDIATEDDVRSLHARLRTALLEPVPTHAGELRVTASAGAVIVGDQEALDQEELLRNADAAMYEAKRTRDGDLVVHSPEMSSSVLGSLLTAGELRLAVQSGQLELHAQPVMRLDDGSTAGAEMLLRWRHPARGLLTPDRFMVAADMGEISRDVGRWVVESVVASAARWRGAFGLGDYRVGFNLSSQHLAHGDVSQSFERALARHGGEPSNFVIEISESTVLNPRSRGLGQLRELRDAGVWIGVDDFGAGNLTLAYLREVDVDFIKVHESVIGLQPGAREEALLRATCGIAESIGAMVVLEGVERLSQLRMAQDCGVGFAQGFLLGLPTPARATRPEASIPQGWRPQQSWSLRTSPDGEAVEGADTSREPVDPWFAPVP